MLDEIGEYVKRRESFAFESTLRGRLYGHPETNQSITEVQVNGLRPGESIEDRFAAFAEYVRLKSRPADIPEAENFEIVNAPVPEPGDNEILVRNIYLSVEPAMEGIRGRVLISD